MPIYEYVCRNCNNKFELMRPFSRAQEMADCAKCHSQAERIMSSCFAMTSGENGITHKVDGNGSSCSSCSSGNCSSCSN